MALFALPGAFTPTCSATHLPGYEEAYDEMRALGIDASDREMLALYRSVDSDRSGQLDWEEFRRLAERLPQLAQLGGPSAEDGGEWH